jgi:polyisoprenyl-teichoic acid--peptidoglycan teichoic acid transferase
MSPRRSRSRHFTFPKDRLTIGLLIAFLVIGIVTAIVAYNYVSGFVSTWNLTNLEGVALPTTAGNISSGATSTPDGSGLTLIPTSGLASDSEVNVEPWDGVSRVNILVMGLDYDWASGGSEAQRTDSMILVTVDPVSMTAGMLSIPRDLWVSIPGFDYGKINTAYWFGQAYNLPGGGPALAIQTVENLLGVTINYYAQIDFFAFIKFIDDIQGVRITIDQEMVVGLLGKDKKTTLEPGTFTLDGETALAYARDRHTENGDFDRSSRQMQVIMAVRDRILEFNMLPNLIARAPDIYADLSAGIHTNLDLEQIIKLAVLASQIDREDITQAVIGADQVEFGTSPDGTQDILIPLSDKIRVLRDEIFTTGGPISPAAVGDNPTQLMVAEGASVSILNGSSTSGLATQTGDYLKSVGMNVVEESNTEQLNSTTITDYSGCPYTVAYLAELLGVSSNNIISAYDPNATVNVVVKLGSDWAANNTLPSG